MPEPVFAAPVVETGVLLDESNCNVEACPKGMDGGTLNGRSGLLLPST